MTDHLRDDERGPGPVPDKGRDGPYEGPFRVCWPFRDGPNPIDPEEGGPYLVDTRDGSVVTYGYSEPEDACLGRDMDVLVHLANNEATHAALLRSRLSEARGALEEAEREASIQTKMADDNGHYYMIAAGERLVEKARADAAEAEVARLNAVVAAYPNATTDLAHWVKPTIALIDEGALQAISPEQEEDEDGGTPWPGQCIGALINGFLDLASDVGKHDRDADQLVHNAIDELRRVSQALRMCWADEQAAVVALSAAGLAMGVHSRSGMEAHAKSVVEQFTTERAARDAAEATAREATAACAAMRQAIRTAKEMIEFPTRALPRALEVVDRLEAFLDAHTTIGTGWKSPEEVAGLVAEKDAEIERLAGAVEQAVSMLMELHVPQMADVIVKRARPTP